MPPLEQIVWVRYRDLLLPSRGRDGRDERLEGCLVYVTHEEAYGRSISWDEFVAEIEGLPQEGIAVFVSKLNWVLFQRVVSDKEFQKSLVRELIESPARERVVGLLDEPDTVAFFEEQLLGLAKWSLLRGEKGGGLSLPGGGRDVGRLLLGVSQLTHLDYEESGNDESDVTRLAIRSLFFNSPERTVTLLTRYYDLWLLRPNSSINRESVNHVDIPAAFRRATGLDLEDYLAGGLALFAHFSRFREPGDFDRRKYQVSWDELGVELGELAAPENLFRQVARTAEEFQEEFGQMPAEPRLMGACLLPFWQHPVLRLSSGEMAPVSHRLLFERLSSGVYWIVHDYLKAKEGEAARARFTRFVGELFQQQVYEILQGMVGGSPLLARRVFGDFPYGHPEVRGPDATVVYEDAVIFVEASVARLRYVETVLAGDLEAFAEDVNKCVLEKTEQLNRVVSDFRAGRFTLDGVRPSAVRIIPVLVLLEPFPHFVVTIQGVERSLEQLGYLQDTEQLHILDGEELLFLDAIVSQGVSLKDILLSKAKHGTYARAAMKNYLNSMFSGRTAESPRVREWYGTLSSVVRPRLRIASREGDDSEGSE